MEKVIKPSAWVVVYKGQVSPPEDGVYRFVAYADDVIAVALNGKTVLLGGRKDTLGHLNVWNPTTTGPRMDAANGQLAYGDWMTLKKGEPIDLDVLVGERPGGLFAAFLLYEKQGRTTRKTRRATRCIRSSNSLPFRPRGCLAKEAPAFSGIERCSGRATNNPENGGL